MIMPGIRDLSNSKYLKQEDIDRPILVTIAGWDKVTLENNNKKSERFILTFKEHVKPLVLNKTNGNRIAKITGKGDDFDDWIGVKIVLFVDPDVEMAGEIVGGIRVRAPKTAAAQKPAQEEENIPDPSITEPDDSDIPF
jgi:hypothetical protein